MNTKWQFGSPPNYEVVNKLLEDGRTKIWPPGSLEEKVQNLIKTWEMENFHKVNIEDFKTLDPKEYTFSVKESAKFGRYKQAWRLQRIPANFFAGVKGATNPADESSISSHRALTTTFPRRFALEILQVYSGLPNIVYKFRRWGYMEGPFKGHAPTGELVEFYGTGIFEGAKIDGSAEAVASSCPVFKSPG
ncbi:hypothetical protein Patl1_08124 [Pistacia atlantica]|uniref:Uncharacterized protein n=1 Tax=Pistacia atlantica TaxID=434234 RepID=A0ACC1AJU6_9ROSI|nr:hypothetical protein Patl1_08124 [Pistacia atlantica]